MLFELLPAGRGQNEGAENLGLLSLMLLHDWRRHARVRDGELVTLEEQGRALWDAAEISEGLALVDQALTTGPTGPYQVQAAIAALHAQARTPASTDWPQIRALYEKLMEFNASAVIALNHAVAVAMSAGLAEGLALIEALGAAGELDRYYPFHAARADILLRMGRPKESAKAYREALALATNRVEQGFLKRRLLDLLKFEQ